MTGDIVEGEVLVGAYRSQQESAIAAAQAMFALPWLTVVPHRRDDIRTAAAIRAHFAIPLIDAVHVATAVANGCDAMLTNDHRLRTPDGLQVLWVDDLEESRQSR